MFVDVFTQLELTTWRCVGVPVPVLEVGPCVGVVRDKKLLRAKPPHTSDGAHAPRRREPTVNRSAQARHAWGMVYPYASLQMWFQMPSL